MKMYQSVLVLLGLWALLVQVHAMPSRNVHTVEFPFARIVNGQNTSIEQHPYQVSIQRINGGHFCGGSLIDAHTVVTAAHCLQTYRAHELQVRLGSTLRSSGGELIAVRAFASHQLYDNGSKINDVGIVKLATPVRQSVKVRYIALAKQSAATGTPAVVTGWGSTCFLFCDLTPQLLEVQLDIVQRQDCASSAYKYGDSIRETMICAEGVKRDACQGDSGGPLVAAGQLVGIVSWGAGCAFNGYPGVYCDVATVRQWILDMAKKL